MRLFRRNLRTIPKRKACEVISSEDENVVGRDSSYEGSTRETKMTRTCEEVVDLTNSYSEKENGDNFVDCPTAPGSKE